MPPELAAIIFCAFIAYLFRRELKDPAAEKISWIPFAWMFVAGSRFVSRWVGLTPPVGENGYLEGSPVDRAFFLCLIVLGVIVLYRRHLPWGRVLKQNKWLIAYFTYCLLSIFWAEDGFVLFKRLTKDLGNPIMALILLTERRPWDAFATTFRRLSFLYLPLSVLFIKYYPDLGRFYTRSGATTYTGVADQKNTLGLTCLLIGVCYLWSFLYRRDTMPAVRHWYHVVLIGMAFWMFRIANSQTALMCLLVAFTIILLAKRPTIARQPTRLMAVTVSAAVFYMVADSAIGLRENVFAWLGRDETLTNRTAIWDIVRAQAGDPWVGVGFMSFWEGPRVRAIADAIGAEGLNQAHNGYLEQYVNLGYVGVAFIFVLALVSLVQIRRQLTINYADAILRFCFVIIALLYNYTEASFYGINNVWVLFLAASIHPPEIIHAAATQPVPIQGSGPERGPLRGASAPSTRPAPAVPQTARWRTRRPETVGARAPFAVKPRVPSR